MPGPACSRSAATLRRPSRSIDRSGGPASDCRPPPRRGTTGRLILASPPTASRYNSRGRKRSRCAARDRADVIGLEGRVGREVNRVGPWSGGGHCAVVLHGELDLYVLAGRRRSGRDRDAGWDNRQECLDVAEQDRGSSASSAANAGIPPSGGIKGVLNVANRPVELANSARRTSRPRRARSRL